MSADEKGDGLGGLLTELGVVAPDSNATAKLSSDQQAIINAYRSGKMEDAEFQQKLADDQDFPTTFARALWPMTSLQHAERWVFRSSNLGNFARQVHSGVLRSRIAL